MQQQYYERCYKSLSSYFSDTDNLDKLNKAIYADSSAQPPTPDAPETTALIDDALCYGSYPNYVYKDIDVNNTAQQSITTSINDLAKEYVLAYVTGTGNDKSLMTITGDVDVAKLPTDSSSKLDFYLYFLVLQGRPVRLQRLQDTLQGANTVIGSIAFTQSLIEELSKELKKENRENAQVPANEKDLWPIDTMVDLKKDMAFIQFSTALKGLETELGTTAQPKYDNFITTKLPDFGDTTKANYYQKYSTLQEFKDVLTASLATEGTDLTNDPKFAAVLLEINGFVVEYFEKVPKTADASTSYTEFMKKIENLELDITYANKTHQRIYKVNTPQITMAEFQATIPSIKTNYLVEMESSLDSIKTKQTKNVQLLITDIAAANKFNSNIEENLDGRMYINVNSHQDAETVVKALLKIEDIQENIYSIKLKYKETNNDDTVEHNKIELVYQQGVMASVSRDGLEFMDSIGYMIQAEVISALSKNGIQGAKDFFPFFQQLGNTENNSSGVAWADENAITNPSISFVHERCTAIAETLVQLNKDSNTLSQTYNNNIIQMFIGEGTAASDSNFNNNDIDAYLPYLRYIVR